MGDRWRPFSMPKPMSSRNGSYELIVVGGGSAGVAAAVGAAQNGARTLLIESYGFLGGAATRSSVLAWCGIYPQRPPPQPPAAVGGVLMQVIAHLRAIGVPAEPYFSASGNWPIPLNPEATKLALDRTVGAAGVEVALHSMVVGASTHEGRIESIRCMAPGGDLLELSAPAFIDASGEVVLATLAGASACPLYLADHPVQPASFPARLTGVAATHGFDKARRAAAMANIVLSEGAARLRADGGIMTPIPGSDDVWWLSIEVSTGGLDGFELASAERDARTLVWRGVAALQAHVPGFERVNVSATGPKIGIRETRHVATLDPLREPALAAGAHPPDSVAIGCWPMEIHHATGKVEYRVIGGAGTYGIQLGALRSRDFDNLWLAGRNIGADNAAYASARVMATAFATGHAAGVAATTTDASITTIQAALRGQGAVL